MPDGNFRIRTGFPPWFCGTTVLSETIMDLLEYWKLRERPYEPTWDTRFFFQGRAHDEALNRLSFVVGEQTMLLGMLTGEIGCGKTLTRAVFSRQLERSHFHVITHENSAFSFNDLLGLTLRALLGEETAVARNKAARWMQFEHTMKRLAAENRHLVLIFDEAQEMSASTLNELKLLTNLNGDGRSYLTLVLVGQPELRKKIAQCPAVNQRVSLRFHLDALSLEESANYLSHRLVAAGHASGDLFDPNAVERAFESTQGVPRALNRLGKLALEFAWLHEYPRVTYAAVDAVARDSAVRDHQNQLIE